MTSIEEFTNRTAAVFEDLLDAAEAELNRPLTEDESDSILDALFSGLDPTENRRSVSGLPTLRPRLTVNHCDCGDEEGKGAEHRCERCAVGKKHQRADNHLPGKHDQSSHGRRSGGTRAGGAETAEGESSKDSASGKRRGKFQAEYQKASTAASRAAKRTEISGLTSRAGDATGEAAGFTKKAAKADTSESHAAAAAAHDRAVSAHESEVSRWLASTAQDARKRYRDHEAAREAHRRAADGHYTRAAEIRRDRDRAATNTTLWKSVTVG